MPGLLAQHDVGSGPDGQVERAAGVVAAGAISVAGAPAVIVADVNETGAFVLFQTCTSNGSHAPAG